mgnify:CR=1 FL=1
MKKIFKVTSEQFNMLLEHNVGKNPINEAFADQTGAVSANVSGNQVYLNFKIDDNDGKYIVSNIFSKFRKNAKNGAYFLTAPVGAVEAFLKGTIITKIFDFLNQKGYSIPTPDQLKVQIEEKSKDVVTAEDKAEARAKYEDLMIKILTNLNDPEIKKLASEVSKFRINPDVTDEAFGHVRSAANALRVLSAKPDATFIATRSQWLTQFNREVKPGATKIILFKKIGSGFDQSKAEKALGVTKDVAYQSPQMKHKFDIAAQSDDSSSGFAPYAVYDISDTVLMPGSRDKDGNLSTFDPFTEKAGLVDNLRGVLNQAAIQFKGVNLNPEDKAKIGAKDTSNKNIEVFSKIFNYMRLQNDLKGVTDNLIKLDPKDDTSVLRAIKAYFSNVAFARAAKDNDLKTNIATAGILAMTEVAPVALAQLIKSNESQLTTLDKPELVSVFGQITKLERIISAKNVVDTTKGITNETEELTERSINSVEDLVGLFGHTMSDLKDGGEDREENNEAIMNEFYNVFNKINNTINEYSNTTRKF